MSVYWSRLCDVDAAPLQTWLGQGPHPWPQHQNLTKPRRLWDVPHALTVPLIRTVLNLPACAGLVAREVCLSLVLPGTVHPMHVDSEPEPFVTRVHVPLVTNEGCWFAWEEDGGKVHFAAGGAYSFDTQARHAFGNSGSEDRIHFCFDLWRAR